MAEALFRHALDAEEDSLKAVAVSSAGVSAFPGQPVSDNSVRSLAKVGIDIKDYSSRPLTAETVDNALAFFGMTDSHIGILSYNIEPAPEHIYLMRQFIEESDDLLIPDPFGGGLREYDACRDSMVEAIPSLIEFVRKLINERDQSQ